MKTNNVVINLIGNNLKIFKRNNQKILSIYNRIRSLQISVPFGAGIIFDKSTYNLEITLSQSFNFYRLLETNLNNLLFSFNRL